MTAQETNPTNPTNGTDLDTDLNLNRRKRRKLTPLESSNAVPNDKNGDCRHQLQQAADDKSELSSVQSTENHEQQSTSPKQDVGAPKISSSPRRTPRKPRAKSSPTSHLSPEIVAPAADNESTQSTQSRQSTPKKKLIKLNGNGKLLSSPTNGSPVPKQKRKSASKDSDAQPHDLRIAIRYGKSPEDRSRIAQKIDEVLDRSVTATAQASTIAKGPQKVTHPFFLGKLAKLETKLSVSVSETSNKDQDSEQESSF